MCLKNNLSQHRESVCFCKLDADMKVLPDKTVMFILSITLVNRKKSNSGLNKLYKMLLLAKMVK